MPEKVLLVCTSSWSNVRKTLQILQGRLFPELQLDILCASAELPYYEGREGIRRVFVFPHRRAFPSALKLQRQLRQEKYDVVAVLWCLETGRKAANLYALLCGGCRLLVFNENLDCDYLSIRFVKGLIKARAHDGTLIRKGWATALLRPMNDGYWGILRMTLFPLRFLILLGSVGTLLLLRKKIRTS